MYYPYIRAKQFELLAIKDLIPALGDGISKISPIIEPVRNSSTLVNILETFKGINLNFTIIINPLVGDLNEDEDLDTIIDILNKTLNGYTNYQLGILVESTDNNYYSEIIEKLKTSDLDFQGYTLIHTSVIKDIHTLLGLINDHKPIINNVINLTLTNSDRRYYRQFDKSTRITLDDYFQTRKRNADYLETEYSSFSQEYLFYEEDGYKGFGDFLTIGYDYSEGGFRPYAVAIHISCVNENNLVIRHFVSNSNGDPSDVAGKFSEAIEKLVEWIKTEEPPMTEGLKRFQKLYDDKHFPGLGVLKKLSIMNHIELVTTLI